MRFALLTHQVLKLFESLYFHRLVRVLVNICTLYKIK
jgi:hypothetical protein